MQYKEVFEILDHLHWFKNISLFSLWVNKCTIELFSEFSNSSTRLCLVEEFCVDLVQELAEISFNIRFL